jgi:hypothetical protein
VDPAEYAVVGVNLAAGVGGAILLGRHLRGASGKPAGAIRYVALLLGVYVLECAAIVAGMLLPVFSAALAVVWGIILGRWLRGRASRRAALRTSCFVALYTSLPAASFMAVPLVLALGGWPILTADGGARLGIPRFIPWPASTVLGFYAAVAIGTLVLKTLITTTGTFLLQRYSSLP